MPSPASTTGSGGTRAQGAGFIANPPWIVFNLRHLITAHLLGGVTSDTDDCIQARNTVEELEPAERTGDLDPGRYTLLR